jgi:hypothetical protein
VGAVTSACQPRRIAFIFTASYTLITIICLVLFGVKLAIQWDFEWLLALILGWAVIAIKDNAQQIRNLKK